MNGTGPAFERLVEVMARLRSPDGCPWDREQTHQTLARHLLEETYEVLEAIDAGDADGLREELGDLVLQVVFHAEIAEETGAFTIADVVDGLREKLVRRHPHVFGETTVTGADHVLRNWEKAKREEKGTGVMDGVPAAMPALARAAKLSRRAEQVGFAWPGIDAITAKLDAELAELHEELVSDEQDAARIEDEMGDVLWVAAVLARRLGLEPETALRKATEKFAGRFRSMEAEAAAAGRELESLSSDEWTEYWNSAKGRI